MLYKSSQIVKVLERAKLSLGKKVMVFPSRLEVILIVKKNENVLDAVLKLNPFVLLDYLSSGYEVTS